MLVDTLRNAEIDQNINFYIFGVGSLGSQILENLVKMGFENIVIYDQDFVESHNISSTIYNNHMVGKKKIEACQGIISNRYGINIIGSEIDGEFKNGKDIPAIVLSCTDNYAARLKALTFFNQMSAPNKAFIDCRTSAWESNITVVLGGRVDDMRKMQKDIQNLATATGNGTGLTKGCGTKVVTQTGVHFVNAMVTQAVLEINQSFSEEEDERGTFNQSTGYYKRILNHREAGLIFGKNIWSEDEN